MSSKYSIVAKGAAVFIIICLLTGAGLITACAAQPPAVPAPSQSSVVPSQYTLKALSIPDVAGTITPSGGSYTAGTKVDITAAPASGYQFDYWEGDASGTSSSIAILMDKEKSVIAHFKANAARTERYMLQTVVEPSGAGVITPETDIFVYGTRVTINASSLPGYKFDYWSGDIESKSSSIEILMDNKKSITAHFKYLYSLSISVYPPRSGTTNPSSGSYELGSSVTVTANPAAGYAFDHWSGDIENNSNPQSLVMDKNRNLAAYFNPVEVDVKEGKEKGLVDVIATGSGFLNRIDVKITSKCKSSIKVNILPGTVFGSPSTLERSARMIILKQTSLSVEPGAFQQTTLLTASVDMWQPTPKKEAILIPVNASLPDDLKLLLPANDFIAADFRVKQYAVWTISDYPTSIVDVKIGTNDVFQKPSTTEWDQIKSMFQQAGISVDKYFNRSTPKSVPK